MVDRRRIHQIESIEIVLKSTFATNSSYSLTWILGELDRHKIGKQILWQAFMRPVVYRQKVCIMNTANNTPMMWSLRGRIVPGARNRAEI